jgi:hypothetical protein
LRSILKLNFRREMQLIFCTLDSSNTSCF